MAGGGGVGVGTSGAAGERGLYRAERAASAPQVATTAGEEDGGCAKKRIFFLFFSFSFFCHCFGENKTFFFLDLLKEQPFHHFLVSLSILELE